MERKVLGKAYSRDLLRMQLVAVENIDSDRIDSSWWSMVNLLAVLDCYVIFPLWESVLSSFSGIVTVACPTPPSIPSR